MRLILRRLLDVIIRIFLLRLLLTNQSRTDPNGRKPLKMTSSFNGDFARLVPRNRASQVLFFETIAYVDKNDTFCLQFMERALAEAYHASSESLENPTDYDTPNDAINTDLWLTDI